MVVVETTHSFFAAATPTLVTSLPMVCGGCTYAAAGAPFGVQLAALLQLPSLPIWVGGAVAPIQCRLRAPSTALLPLPMHLGRPRCSFRTMPKSVHSSSCKLIRRKVFAVLLKCALSQLSGQTRFGGSQFQPVPQVSPSAGRQRLRFPSPWVLPRQLCAISSPATLLGCLGTRRTLRPSNTTGQLWGLLACSVTCH